MTSNPLPKPIANLCAPANCRRNAKARKLHFKLPPLYKALFSETNPNGIKAALAANKAIKEEFHLPLTPMGDANTKRLRAVVRRLQL